MIEIMVATYEYDTTTTSTTYLVILLYFSLVKLFLNAIIVIL